MVGASKAINFVCWFWLVWFGPVNGWPQSAIIKSREDIFTSWLIHMMHIPWLAYLFMFQILFLCHLPLVRWAIFWVLRASLENISKHVCGFNFVGAEQTLQDTEYSVLSYQLKGSVLPYLPLSYHKLDNLIYNN
jgi:hypothetical protein